MNGQSTEVTEYSNEWNTQRIQQSGMILPRVKEASSIIHNDDDLFSHQKLLIIFGGVAEKSGNCIVSLKNFSIQNYKKK